MARSNTAIERELQLVSDWLNQFPYEDPRTQLGLAVHNALEWARGRRADVRQPLDDLKRRGKNYA